MMTTANKARFKLVQILKVFGVCSAFQIRLLERVTGIHSDEIVVEYIPAGQGF